MSNAKSNPKPQCPIRFQRLIYELHHHLSLGFGISFVIGILAFDISSLSEQYHLPHSPEFAGFYSVVVNTT